MTALLLLAGLGFLVAGAELLVRGASRIATAIGLSPLVIGLTIVAFGTSAPELAVSTSAAFAGGGDIALGNVVGSNIFNVLFILGLSALVTPLVVARQVVRSEVPVMIGVSFLLVLLALDGTIGRGNGALLTAGIVAYTTILVRNGRREAAREAREAGGADQPPDERATSAEPSAAEGSAAAASALAAAAGRRRPVPAVIADPALVVAGLALLVLGSGWLVDGARELARTFGVSDLVIGLTIVAGGTSLPELATSIIAGIRGQRDIAVGNVVGSNIFNILGILGVSALLAPGGIPVNPAALAFDVPIMTFAAVACLPVFFTGHRIARWEGAVFLGYYIAYTAYLVLAAGGHEAVPLLRVAMLYFALPVTVLTLGILMYRGLRGASPD